MELVCALVDSMMCCQIYWFTDAFREEMEFDMAALNELQLAIYVFHEAVCLSTATKIIV